MVSITVLYSLVPIKKIYTILKENSPLHSFEFIYFISKHDVACSTTYHFILTVSSEFIIGMIFWDKSLEN
jgi:hypothetical protein